jgi:hypothetical protein
MFIDSNTPIVYKFQMMKIFKTFYKYLKIILGILFLSLQGSPGSMGGEDIYKFPKNEEIYFSSDHLTGSEFMIFQRDGTYTEYNREHLFVAQSDSGRWIQKEDGKIWMCSDYQFKEIIYGERTINVYRKEKYDALPAFANALSSFLGANHSKRFSKSQLETLAAVEFTNDISELPNPTPRKVIEDMSHAIRTYLESKQVNLYKSQTWSYKGKVFLIGRKSWDPDKKQLKAELDKGKGWLMVSFALSKIGADEFRKSISSTQPFIFFAEMNKLTEGSDEKIKDIRPTKIIPQCGEFPVRSQ